MKGEITLDDFDIIFNNKGDSLNCEDGNLGGIVLDGYEVEEDSLSMYEVMRRFYYKIILNYWSLTK